VSRATEKSRRRAELIDGALEVLAEQGLEGFTTGRIAAQAGLTQSGFYKYWPDRDAALKSVAEHVGAEVLRLIREARLAVGGDVGRLRESFAGALRAMLAQRRTVELFLRFRREPGPLGDVFRELVERALDELHTDMVSSGLVGAGDPVGPRLAVYAVSASLGAVEALLDERFDDVGALADDLGRIAAAVLGAR
jgi:AcrR family transcriptional regulator